MFIVFADRITEIGNIGRECGDLILLQEILGVGVSCVSCVSWVSWW